MTKRALLLAALIGSALPARAGSPGVPARAPSPADSAPLPLERRLAPRSVRILLVTRNAAQANALMHAVERNPSFGPEPVRYDYVIAQAKTADDVLVALARAEAQGVAAIALGPGLASSPESEAKRSQLLARGTAFFFLLR